MIEFVHANLARMKQWCDLEGTASLTCHGSDGTKRGAAMDATQRTPARGSDKDIVAERKRAEYWQRQRRVRSGRAGTADRPRPLEFDESGFPIAQRNSSFVQRVARLLNPL